MFGVNKSIDSTFSGETSNDGSCIAAVQGKKAPIEATSRPDIHLENRKVYRDGVQVRLSPREYEVIELFMLYPGRILSKDELLRHFWLLDFISSTKVVDVYVKNIRRKLGEHFIEDVGGVGYRLRT